MGNLIGNLGRAVTLVAAALFLFSCQPGGKAVINLDIEDGGGRKVVLTRLDVNKNSVVDTLVCDESGHLRYAVKVPADNPDFFYLYEDGNKIASLVLAGGDKVEVRSDSSGNFSVTGSSDCSLLQEAEAKYREVTEQFEILSDRLVANYKDVDKADGFRREMGKLFVSHYRECVAFVMEHPSSMASVSVLFQRVGDNLGVFATDTDVAHFKRVRDSIAAIYPHSKYLPSLDEEISSREDALALRIKLENSGETGFPDLILPDVNGNYVQLSSVGKPLVLLHFWTASEASNNIYNTQVLKPLYDKYKGQGLEIYAVSFDTDKALWAGIVKEQNTGWINVNDFTSSSAGIYNVTELPRTYVIAGSTVVDSGSFNKVQLERIIRAEI